MGKSTLEALAERCLEEDDLLEVEKVGEDPLESDDVLDSFNLAEPIEERE